MVVRQPRVGSQQLGFQPQVGSEQLGFRGPLVLDKASARLAASFSVQGFVGEHLVVFLAIKCLCSSHIWNVGEISAQALDDEVRIQSLESARLW